MKCPQCDEELFPGDIHFCPNEGENPGVMVKIDLLKWYEKLFKKKEGVKNGLDETA